MGNLSNLESVMTKIGYQFKDSAILAVAFYHKSFGNERRANKPLELKDNERLEFLGDAVLDLAITVALLKKFPDSSEGELSKLRASLVNEKLLASVARQLGIGEYLSLGKGEEQTGGREKDSILSSTFEALVAAVFIDGGFEKAAEWLHALFADRIIALEIPESSLDFKTKLQEVSQAKFKSTPRYEVIQSFGPDHDKTFEVNVLVNNQVVAKGLGKSKKEAEQHAAQTALLDIENQSE